VKHRGLWINDLCRPDRFSDILFAYSGNWGVAGFGYIVEIYPNLPVYFTYGGILFLVLYGSQRLWAAYKGNYNAEIVGQAKSLGVVIASLAAVTWLNPHVYLDTLALLGAISVQYEIAAQRFAFGVGAVTASFVFFFFLGYGAMLVAPYFQSERFWRGLDIVIALVMFAIAFGLYQTL